MQTRYKRTEGKGWGLALLQEMWRVQPTQMTNLFYDLICPFCDSEYVEQVEEGELLCMNCKRVFHSLGVIEQ